MEDKIINRVANSPIVTLNLEEFHHAGERVIYDMADHLEQGVLLREKDFRSFVKEHDWETYRNKNVAITCSADAIVPTWAYMLLTTKLEGVAHMVVMGDEEVLAYALFTEALRKIDLEKLKDRPVVVKGCGDLPIPDLAYVEVTRLLKPHVKALMYGEPCSTVPLYKKPRPSKI